MTSVSFEPLSFCQFQINDKFGRLDVIINNAGIIGNEGKLCDIPIEAYHRVIGVNLHGAWYTLK